MKILLLCLLAACTADHGAIPADGGTCPVLPACGPAPVMPETHPTWTSGASGDVLQFNYTDGSALVKWTWDVQSWQNCMSGTK